MSAPTLASIARPATVAVAAPVVAERKQNPKEKAAIDKGLAEVRVERIRVDGLVSQRDWAGWNGGVQAVRGGVEERRERRGRAQRAPFLQLAKRVTRC